jgi:hypothetical protein
VAAKLRKGYSENSTYDELMRKLAELAGEWRGSKDPVLVERYQHVLLTLIELWWSGLSN